MRTYYDDLQVAENASTEVIRGAYRYLAHKWHPDKNPDNSAEAERISTLINEAYAVLSDPDRRKAHDQWIKTERQKAEKQHRPHQASRSSASSARKSRIRNHNNNESLLKRVWLMLLFTGSLVIMLGVLPYQLLTSEFRWGHLLGFAFCLSVAYYAYMALFHPENVVVERRREVEAQRKASKVIWIAALVSWPMWCVAFLIFYGEYGVEFAIVASTVAAMLVGVAVFVVVTAMA